MASTPLRADMARDNVIAFPMSAATDLRQRLSRCLTIRAHDRWTEALKRARDGLDSGDYLDLVARATAKRFELMTEGR